MYEIVIGRTESDRHKLGIEGTIFIGKMYVRMGQTTSLSNKVLMDVVNPHVILIVGKRGQGKSHSIGVMAEEISNLPEKISQNIAVLIIDTMGIFWTMKFPNEREEDLLNMWNLKPTATLKANIFIPKGFLC